MRQNGLAIILIVAFLGSGLLGIQCGKGLSEDEYYAKAQDYEQSEEYEKAAETFLKLSKRYPTGKRAPEAMFRAAIIYASNLQKYDVAVDIHKKLTERYPDSKYAAQSLFMVGFIYANHIKDYKKAEKAYRAFLEKYPQHDLVASVKWELDHLGQDINEIDFLRSSSADSVANPK